MFKIGDTVVAVQMLDYYDYRIPIGTKTKIIAFEPGLGGDFRDSWFVDYYGRHIRFDTECFELVSRPYDLVYEDVV